MTEVDQDQDKATRYHEAAHAVFAVRVCDGEVLYVDVDEMYCRIRLPRPHGLVNYWGETMLTLAGEAAAYLAVRGEIRFWSWEELSDRAQMEAEGELDLSDSYDVMECLREMGGDPDQVYRAVVEETEKAVRELWREISAVADALREQRRLSGDEVVRLIDLPKEGQG